MPRGVRRHARTSWQRRAVDTNAGLYKFVLVLHILSIVAGIGTTMLNGVYAAKAKKAGGPMAGAIMQANFDVTVMAEKIIYTIPLWGILLVLMSDDQWGFDQTWIWLSIVLFVIALGIAHGVMMKGGKRMLAMGPQLAQGDQAAVAEAGALEKRLAAGGMTLNLLATALIALMIWKPGV